MKQLIAYILLLACFACSENFEPQINSYSFELQLEIPEDAIAFIDNMRGLDVTFTNKYKDYEFTATSDTNGLVVVEAMEAGIYTISSVEEFKKEKVTLTLHGTGDITLDANQKDSTTLIEVYTQEGGGGFVIREYYYSGSLTPEGEQYLSDQYVEIYNNSGDTLYADSLMFLEAESYGNSPDYWEYMHEDSFVVKMIWTLPSTTGNEFPIAPGTGFIMAKDPMNHKTDPFGNSNSPVDLGDAEFDFWSDKTPDGDIDFPAPNLIPKLWVYKGTDIAFHSRGGSAIAIAQVEGNIDEYIANNLITMGTATASSNYFCKISNDDVIDAVEVTWSDKLYKRIPLSLDAGSTAIDAGAKSGLCVRRKIDMILGGRAVYQDTNNSTFDFEHDVVPMPKVYE